MLPDVLNCAALAMTPDLYDSLSRLRTCNGFTFDDVIQDGIDEKWRIHDACDSSVVKASFFPNFYILYYRFLRIKLKNS